MRTVGGDPGNAVGRTDRCLPVRHPTEGRHRNAMRRSRRRATTAAPAIVVLLAIPRTMRRSFTLGLLIVLSACSNDGSSVSGVIDGISPPAAVVPVPWVDGAWVQPVPSWGSSVRLHLPVPLDSIILGPGGGLGFFGAHEGGHVEGLDHVWIPTKPGTVVGSWADGTVQSIQYS